MPQKLGAEFCDLPMPTKITQQTNGATKPNPSPFVTNIQLFWGIAKCRKSTPNFRGHTLHLDLCFNL